MTQDEIDVLMQSISTGEFENPAAQLGESTLNPDDVRYRYNDIVACKARYEYAVLNGSRQDIAEAAKNLHRAAFANWLLRSGFSSKEDYAEFMNNEAKKRGLKPPFKRYVK
jgi:vancomycin permeability regulator SanA